ncbi:MAG: hypothetical protein IH994_09105 [Proteobacteria bacterium]|nr:hypothetical protein [Pseudomonadota bacterium]
MNTDAAEGTDIRAVRDGAISISSIDLGPMNGAPADLLLFDPDEGWKVDADKLAGKAQNSPFDGRPVQGRVLKTVIDGRLVFEPDA